MRALLANAFILSVLLTFSHTLLKWVSERSELGQIEAMLKYWWLIGMAVSIYLGIFIYYAYILRKLHISSLYPSYTGLSVVMVTLVGVIAFNEPFSVKQIIGVVMLILGLFLVSST